MDKKLCTDGLTKFLAGLLLVGALLFIPAGSLSYWQAWLFICVLFLPMLIAGIIMLRKNPELLRKRLNSKEKRGEQKAVVALGGLMFLAAFILAGLNHRFEWITLPSWVSWAAAGVFLLGYGLYAEVLRENAYLSRTIEVQENQKVIDSGLYGTVRHPMYMSTVIMFLSMPLALGSVISFIVMLAYIPIIVKRIKDEEQLLEKELDGYTEYERKVKFRLVPFVW